MPIAALLVRKQEVISKHFHRFTSHCALAKAMDATRLEQLKPNASVQRRLNIEHQLQLTSLRQDHQLNVKFLKHREEMFRRTIERLQAYACEPPNLATPHCFARVRTGLRLLRFSSHERNQATAVHNKSSPTKNHHLPAVVDSANSSESGKSVQRLPLDQTRPFSVYACRSRSQSAKYSQAFLKQQILNEHENQLKHAERKVVLLKELDELKHTIDDPHSSLSALAALSRALISLNVGME